MATMKPKATQWPVMTSAEVMAAIGEQIQQARIKRRLTQADLAKRTGISVRTLADLEAGKGTRLATLIDVARALGLLGPLMEALSPAETVSPMQLLRESKAAKSAPKRVRKASTKRGGNG